MSWRLGEFGIWDLDLESWIFDFGLGPPADGYYPKGEPLARIWDARSGAFGLLCILHFTICNFHFALNLLSFSKWVSSAYICAIR